jgi:hypothetical protein
MKKVLLILFLLVVFINLKSFGCNECNCCDSRRIFDSWAHNFEGFKEAFTTNPSKDHYRCQNIYTDGFNIQIKENITAGQVKKNIIFRGSFGETIWSAEIPENTTLRAGSVINAVGITYINPRDPFSHEGPLFRKITTTK